MTVTPEMVREAEEEAMRQADENPEGHHDDWIHEASWIVVSRRFPSAPDWEKSEAAEELRNRVSLPPWMQPDPEFDIS